jgi:hypothetical protein
MSRIANPSGGPRRSWRADPQDASLSPGQRRVLRALVTLAVVALTVLLAWWLWPVRMPAPRVLRIVPHYGSWTTPPVPGTAEGGASWNAALATGSKEPTGGPSVSGVVRTVALDRSGPPLGAIASALDDLATDPQAPLIAVVAAHGLGHNGQAVLLGGGATVGEERIASEDRLPLADLLRTVATRQAAVKLVVLDVGWIAFDARLGVVADEFPELVARAVEQVKDPSLWVLTSCAPWQTAQAYYDPARQGVPRSVFGDAVLDGLSGQADRDPADGMVSLDELHRHVWSAVVRWTSRNTEGASQTPRLYRGGSADPVPLDDRAGGEVHLSVPRRDRTSKTSDTPSEDPAAGSAQASAEGAQPAGAVASPTDSSAGAEGTAGGASGTSGESPAPAAVDPAASGGSASAGSESATVPAGSGSGSAPAAASPTSAELAALAIGTRDPLPWIAAWELRDALEQRAAWESPEVDVGGWSPADYAPHLWQAYQAQLLAYERWLRAGEAYSSQGASLLQQEILTARALVRSADAWPPTGASVATSAPALLENRVTVDRLRVALQGFLDDPSRQQFDAGLPELAPLRQIVRLRNQVLCLAPWYLRWRARRGYDDRREFAEKLSQLDRALDGVWQRLEADDAPRQPLDRLVSGGSLAPAVADGRELLQGIWRNVQDEVRLLAAAPGGQARRIEDLLDTPLPNAAQRRELLGVLIQATRAPEASSAEPPPPPPSVAPSTLPIDLELELLSLVLPADDAELAHCRTLRAGAVGSHAADLRELGAHLATAWQKVPSLVGAPTNAAANRLSAVPYLIDPRDAKLLDDRYVREVLAALPRLPDASRRRPRIRVVTESTPAWRVDALERSTELTVVLAADGPRPARVTVRADFDAARLSLTTATGESLARPAPDAEPPAYSVPWGDGDTLPLTFLVQAHRASGATEDVAITFSADGGSLTWNAAVELPQPRFELVLESAADGLPVIEEPTESTVPNRVSVLQVPLYPNAENILRGVLENRTGGEVSRATVRLNYPPEILNPEDARRLQEQPEQLLDRIRRGRWPSFGAARTLGGAASAPAAAPDAPPAWPCPLFPKQDRPAVPTAAAEGAPAEAPAPLELPSLLVCTIEEVGGANPPRRWIKWLEFRPFHPDRYLDIVEAGRVGQRMSARVRAKRGDALALPVEGSHVELLVRASQGQDVPLVAGVLSREQPELLLQTDLALVRAEHPEAFPPEEAWRSLLLLTVDGYPRAFAFPFDMLLEEQELKRARGLAEVWLDPPAPPPVELAWTSRAEIAVGLRADGPEGAFRADRPEGAARIAISVGDREQPDQTFFADRQVTVELLESLDSGEATIVPRVRDLAFNVPLSSHRGKVRISATLELTGRLPADAARHLQDSFDVIVDADGPEIEALQTTPRPVRGKLEVALGLKLELAVKVRDADTDVKELKLELFPIGSTDGQPLQTLQANRDTEADVWRATVDTKDLTPGTDYLLRATAVDRVGNTGQRKEREFHVSAMAAVPAGTAGVTLAVHVTYRNYDQEGFEVELDDGQQAAVTDAEGVARFPVALGQHSIRVRKRTVTYREEKRSPPNNQEFWEDTATVTVTAEDAPEATKFFNFLDH